jgi:hypothetical protein
MKKSTVYVAYVNSDLTEGKGFSVPLVVCELKETAERLGKGKNTQGSNAVVRPVDLIEITEGSVAKWYAPFEECIQLHAPSKEDTDLYKKRMRKERIIQKAKDAGLSEREIKILTEK